MEAAEPREKRGGAAPRKVGHTPNQNMNQGQIQTPGRGEAPKIQGEEGSSVLHYYGIQSGPVLSVPGAVPGLVPGIVTPLVPPGQQPEISIPVRRNPIGRGTTGGNAGGNLGSHVEAVPTPTPHEGETPVPSPLMVVSQGGAGESRQLATPGGATVAAVDAASAAQALLKDPSFQSVLAAAISKAMAENSKGVSPGKKRK